MEILYKWKETTGKDINIADNNNHYIIDYNGISCKIEKPNKNYGFYLVSSNGGTDYEWYDIINRYCIEKSPSEKNLISRLVKYIESQPKVQTQQESVN